MQKLIAPVLPEADFRTPGAGVQRIARAFRRQ
jgi:hypothetical protein